MENFIVFLRTRSEGHEERFCAEAKRHTADGGAEFSFVRGEERYSVRTGLRPQISADGEISYRIPIGLSETFLTNIRTPFGEIPVEVKTERFVQKTNGEAVLLSADYILNFSDFRQKHSIFFKAKPKRT